MSACGPCHSPHKAVPDGSRTTFGRRIRDLLAWLLPTALLAVVPKCPACLILYLAIWTGISVSIGTASYLRLGMLAFSAAILTYLGAKQIRSLLLLARNR